MQWFHKVWLRTFGETREAPVSQSCLFCSHSGGTSSFSSCSVGSVRGDGTPRLFRFPLQLYSRQLSSLTYRYFKISFKRARQWLSQASMSKITLNLANFNTDFLPILHVQFFFSSCLTVRFTEVLTLHSGIQAFSWTVNIVSACVPFASAKTLRGIRTSSVPTARQCSSSPRGLNHQPAPAETLWKARGPGGHSATSSARPSSSCSLRSFPFWLPLSSSTL